MSATSRDKGSPEAVLTLLTNEDVRADARRFHADAVAFRNQAPTQNEWLQEMTKLREPFVARWGVPPPPTRELVDPDSRRQAVEAIGSGGWGMIPVFPWTRDREMHTPVRTIRRRTHRQHQDALDRGFAQRADWLQDCGFDLSTIARVVYERSTGLRRPTTTQAIARTPDEREIQIRREYKRQAEKRGIPADTIARWVDQRVYRRLRGSEARASAAVRMASRRYLERIERLNERLASPTKSEPVSYALTKLLEAVLNNKSDVQVRQRAEAVRIALIVKIPRRLRIQRIEAIESDRWGLVPVFPWTTNAQIRELVKTIRTDIRRRPKNPLGVARTKPESLGRALTKLLRALRLGEADAAVRQHAGAVHDSMLRMIS
jgi:hypothetical protein